MSFTVKQFWKSIRIWMKNSHVVNRRLSGVLQLLFLKFSPSNITYESVIKSLLQSDLYSVLLENVKNLHSVVNFQQKCFQLSEDEFEADSHGISSENLLNFYLVVQKLLPKNTKYKETFRLVLLDPNSNVVTFISFSEKSDKLLLSPDFPYSIVLIENEILLKASPDTPENPSMVWLTQKLFPRILKWALSDISNKNSLTEGSLNLISLEEYNDTYQKLKMKYGKNIVEIWPETTDPSKFVYEDVAIAAYLLLLWKDERHKLGNSKMQSFIDLGCGNGLLVYILCSEGHIGRGLDVRKRGIWDMYPSFVKLEIETIVPSENCIYHNVDWIIGNHSDELTPWIPVIAANSSYDCRFFLLPCCAYEFDGQKYQRQNSSKSQYNEYLEYVNEICTVCGINTSIDRLKIPSTKRTCFVGSARSYPRIDMETQLIQLNTYIKERCKKTLRKYENTSIEDDTNISLNFKVRESVEKVQNCTKIQKDVIEDIVKLISTRLLKEINVLDGCWNCGGCLPLNEVSKLIPPELLKFLKNECGGLQTLLRNNHNIFEVNSGNVKLRYPRTKFEVTNKLKIKNKCKKCSDNIVLTLKPCWFYNNHPDGCPLTAELCSYSHVK